MSGLRVAVLGGGRSSEHEVSLASAASIRAGLREAGHTPVAVTIEREGHWLHDGRDVPLTAGGGLLAADAVFPALHGPFGEDGTVQGLLECLDVPYVGAGVLASALCMDKVVFKELMARAGMPQVAYASVRHADYRRDPGEARARIAALGSPVFVKPARLGSSVGIVRVGHPEELADALETAFRYDPLLIVEAGAAGLEVECSVMGNADPVASEPGEIVLRAGDGWYDYKAKYTAGGMELVVPARISASARDAVRTLACETFVASGCAGLARVDFFVDGEAVLVNELNTMPGFTATSVFAKLFGAGGLAYPELLERLVHLGIERHATERAHSF